MDTCNIIREESLEKGFFFEDFDSYESFIESDFFQNYYDLWNYVLRYSSDENILQLYTTNKRVENLQRMLVMLGYLKITDLSWSFRDIEPDYCSMPQNTSLCDSETLTFYLWVFWSKTDRAVRDIQWDEWLETDWEVWWDTRDLLYRKIYQMIHDGLNDERNNIFTLTHEELSKMCS